MSPARAPAAIALRGVEKRFGRVAALRGVDLEVPSGSIQALVGPNGAGKTTLLRVLAGLARPTAGSVRVGADAADRRGARRAVGFIGHATFLYPELTARENLVFAARLYALRDPRARAAALLDDYELAAVADRPAGGLSRGMAQRLAIARGLVHDPGVVLLDEPFSGLDPRSADRLAQRLAAMRAAGRTLVLVTHDLARAAALADRTSVLVAGRVARAADHPLDARALEGAYRGALEAAA